MATKVHLPLEFEDDDELDSLKQLDPGTVAAVVTGTDWTTETIVNQLKRQNIQLNPRFQRRDAWKRNRKSRLIESLIVGLPIPQLVLAESKDERGKFIVLDGKQRLLAILQFWGLGEGDNNAYALSELPLRTDLVGQTYATLSTDVSYAADYNALCNQSVRTVVIRNWKDSSFLHAVFLRLNTGSVSLSPQELRQALLPGGFSDFVDDEAGKSPGLHSILGVNGPDARMRDIEILARFLAFRFFADKYPGRMTRFLDFAFSQFNGNWAQVKGQINAACTDFEDGVAELLEVFGDGIARKPESVQFNRAIFDALIYYHSDKHLLATLKTKRPKIRQEYGSLFAPGSAFLKAVESDTAGAPNTKARLDLWAASLSKVVGHKVKPPAIPVAAPTKTKAGGNAKKKG